MTSFTLPTANTSAAVRSSQTVSKPQVLTNLFEAYRLQWRQEILFVSFHENSNQGIPASITQLSTRLTNSPVRCVCIDAAMGEAHVTAWAAACQQAGKDLYVRSRTAGETVSTSSWTHQFLNTILNPVLSVIAEVVNTSNIAPVLYKEWVVGQRGKVFQAWQVCNVDPVVA